MQLLDLPGQDGVLIDDAVNDCIGSLIDAPDLHDVDTLLGRRANGDELTSHILAGTQEFVTFQRRKDKHLCSFPPHSECEQLHCEGFARSRGADNCHIRVFIDTRIEDIHDHETVVVLVHTQQYAVLVGHLIGGEGVAARSC